MVTDNHYRWDFIGLSTDTKPTPATSEKVVDGSTYYESDTSKLYVYCTDDWYERKPLGGGGTSYTAGDGIDITDNTISVDTETIQPKLTAGNNITIDNNVISAITGGGVTTLTTADYNYPTNNPDGVALWLLPEGWYNKEASNIKVYTNRSSYNATSQVLYYVSPENKGTINYKTEMYQIYGDVNISLDIVSTNIGGSLFTNQRMFLIGRGINNNLTTTESNYVLDARQGKELKDLIDALDARVSALEG